MISKLLVQAGEETPISEALTLMLQLQLVNNIGKTWPSQFLIQIYISVVSILPQNIEEQSMAHTYQEYSQQNLLKTKLLKRIGFTQISKKKVKRKPSLNLQAAIINDDLFTINGIFFINIYINMIAIL